MTVPPSARQMRALAAYLKYGTHALAAHAQGISVSHQKNSVSEAMTRLGVGSAGEAAIVLGWLCLPDDEELDRASVIDNARGQLENAIARARRVLGQ